MPAPLSFGLTGAGWIGSFHGETLAGRLPTTRLAAVGVEPSVTGVDARKALEIALAAQESVETKTPIVLNGVLQ